MQKIGSLPLAVFAIEMYAKIYAKIIPHGDL